MILPGMVVVFIIILLVFYVSGYPIPPILLRAIYAIIIILPAHRHRASGFGTRRPRTGDAHHTLT
jgi:hypothetical protein